MNMEIDLDMNWRETTIHQRNLKIFREEFDAWLPDVVLDFHVHVFNAEAVPVGKPFSCGGHPIAQYTFEELDRDLTESFPGRQTAAVVFGFPDPAYNQRSNDAYIAQYCDRQRWFGLRLLDPFQDDPQRLRQEVLEGGFFGLKPYLNYVRKENPNLVEIPEMLPDWSMEVANDLGLIVMLHIPRSGRLADPLNKRQLRKLCQDYPNARIVLAHIGRAYFYRNIVGHLEEFLDLPNLYFDLAMVNHAEVMEYLFRRARPEQVLFGTDIPIALAPGKSVEINDQYTYVTPKPWSLSISDDHGKLVFTSFLYEELRGIKQAADRAGWGRGELDLVFSKNGFQLLKDVGAHLATV